MVAFRKARHYFVRSRYVVGALCIAVGIGAALMTISGGDEHRALADNPAPNDPIGVARGIHPGRVVWVHDPNATDWDGPGMGDGHWWESGNTNMAVVDYMMSRAIRAVAGENDSTEAWDKIFRYFNQTHGKGDVGYWVEEKITIKVNLVGCIGVSGSGGVDPNTYDLADNMDYMNTSPQMMLALLRQLVYEVGINQADIAIGDTLCYFPNQYYDMLHDEFPDVRYLDYEGKFGRTGVQQSSVPLYWSSHPLVSYQDYVPVSYAEADYIINMANFKSHSSATVTLCGKNHYGSLVRWPAQSGYYDLHNDLPSDRDGMGHYRPLVDLMGHAHIGGKTLLYLIDGLYAGHHPYDDAPTKLNSAPFNGDWSSSLFVSQDPVAIDSVAFDFLWAEPGWSVDTHMAGGDDYLHEAAQADNPPSGAFYDPDHSGDVTRLASLGVHEHWNNPEDRQYSRNLDTGDGIELISLQSEFCVDPSGDGTHTDLQSALTEAQTNGEDDVIKVVQGTYIGNFSYSSSQGNSITLLGGCTSGCTGRDLDPSNTVLDGGGSDRVLYLYNHANGGHIVVEGFTLQNGDSSGEGGGVYAYSWSDPGRSGDVTLTNNIVTGNTAVFGGGVLARSDSSSGPSGNVTLTKNIVTGNTAGNYGGGIYAFSSSETAGNVTLANNIVTGNTATGYSGGGIVAYSDSWSGTSGNVTLTNNTVTGNAASDSGGGVWLIFNNIVDTYNNIIWGNTAPMGGDIYLEGSGTANGYNNDYSSMSGSWTNSGSNINDDPDFVGGGDYHLTGDSPCIDTGDNNAPNIPLIDFEGYPRIWDGNDDSTFVVDMGAYEYRTGVIDEIVLLTPNGGEVIPSGSTYTVQWYTPSDPVSFKLKYSMDNGNTWKTIGSGITDTSYDWTVPTPPKNKTRCLVKVVAYDASEVKVGADKSNSKFTIEVVKLTSPNGGEVLTSGDQHTITWTTHETKSPVAKVILKYTKNGGNTWNKIVTLDGNPGIYDDWTVPNVPKAKIKCKVKVVLKDARGNKVGSDTSDSSFTIEPAP